MEAAPTLAWAAALLVLAFTVMESASAPGLSLVQRWVFHAAHVFPASLVAWALSVWLMRRPARRHWPAWVLLSLAGLAAGFVLAPWSVALEGWFGVVDGPATAAAAHWRVELLQEFVEVPPRTALFWLAMNGRVLMRPAVEPTALRRLGVDVEVPAAQQPLADDAPKPDSPMPNADAPPTPALPAHESAPALFERLPVRLGRDVVQLNAQQHYLRVVTSKGEYLLLNGFASAIDEMERSGIRGAQIHRSLWVAWRHVERLDLRPEKPSVVLRNGERLPIGRRRVSEITDAWRRWPGD